MTKRNRIIYWIATGWLALGMLSPGIVQLLRMEEEVTSITHLGYPVYLLPLLGIWKVLGVVAVLVPRMPLLKEWAYAGFFFAMSGAIASRLIVGDGFAEVAPSLLLLVLTLLSWHFRPSDDACPPQPETRIRILSARSAPSAVQHLLSASVPPCEKTTPTSIAPLAL